jgi:voltage-gated potassium channel Kch
VEAATFRERVRYGFDNFMARGTIALVIGLFAISAMVILVVGVIVGIVDLARGDEGGPGWDVPTAIWNALLRTLDPGTMGGDQGGPFFLLAMLFTTFAGLFIVSALIGIINTGLESKLGELRKGRSRVIEARHTVILGWSQQIFTVIEELAIANANQKAGRIVILADRDKVEMEDEIRARVPDTGRTRVVCRSGSPVDVDDLDIASLKTSRSIIVLSPESDDADADVIKTVLAITNGPRRRPEPYHIVAEIRDPANLEVARMVGREEAELVLVGDLIARIVAQTCRQSGLSVVYTELLDFAGDEIYISHQPSLEGLAFRETLLAFEESTVIGIVPADGTGALLNPGMDRVLAPGDRVVVITEDDDTVKAAEAVASVANPGAIVEPRRRTRAPERTLVLGWNWRAPAIMRELDAYVPPGSTIHVVADLPSADAEAIELGERLRNMTVTATRGDTTERRLLDSLNVGQYDHLIVLCYSDEFDVQRADARTLITLLHLRDISSKLELDLSITSEMLDLRNRALAEVTKADDFIVSERLTSLLITQISENKELRPVFDDLFDPEGAEIYLRPADEYIRLGEEVTFATVIEAARQRGEVAIGFRRREAEQDAAQAYGVTLNPRKSTTLRFASGDRVIVLAEDGLEEAAAAA